MQGFDKLKIHISSWDYRRNIYIYIPKADRNGLLLMKIKRWREQEKESEKNLDNIYVNQILNLSLEIELPQNVSYFLDISKSFQNSNLFESS